MAVNQPSQVSGKFMFAQTKVFWSSSNRNKNSFQPAKCHHPRCGRKTSQAGKGKGKGKGKEVTAGPTPPVTPSSKSLPSLSASTSFDTRPVNHRVLFILSAQYRIRPNDERFASINIKHWMEVELSQENYELLKHLGWHYIYLTIKKATHDKFICIRMWEWVSFFFSSSFLAG